VLLDLHLKAIGFNTQDLGQQDGELLRISRPLILPFQHKDNCRPIRPRNRILLPVLVIVGQI
jgi:hypothetical protein